MLPAILVSSGWRMPRQIHLLWPDFMDSLTVSDDVERLANNEAVWMGREDRVWLESYFSQSRESGTSMVDTSRVGTSMVDTRRVGTSMVGTTGSIMPTRYECTLWANPVVVAGACLWFQRCSCQVTSWSAVHCTLDTGYMCIHCTLHTWYLCILCTLYTWYWVWT